MKKSLDLGDFFKIVKETAKIIQENAIYLCELDSVIGDGDHGTTLARGFTQALNVVEEQQPSTISSLLITVGNTMIETMGGASGPIFGSLFKDMGKAAKGKEEVTVSDLHEMYDRGAQKIMKLGQSKAGDKTVLDSLLPAIEQLQEAAQQNLDIIEAYQNMLDAAKMGVDATKSMIATKGRARYAGERGIGHQDAGATSMYLMLQAAYNTVRQ